MNNVTNLTEAVVEKELDAKVKWENFVNGKLVNFAELNGLENISVNNGLGGKARLKRDKTENWIVSITWEGVLE